MTVPDLGEVLFEFRRMGAMVRITAVHVASGTEVVLAGAVSGGEHAWKTAAIQKLIYVLKRTPRAG